MNAIIRISAVLLVAQSVIASPCSDGCYANCQYANSVCAATFPDFLKTVCTMGAKLCTSSCDLVCGCADKCLAPAKDQFLKCRGENVTDVLLATGCQGLFLNSVLICGGQCGLSSLVGVASQLPKLLLSYAANLVGPALMNMT